MLDNVEQKAGLSCIFFILAYLQNSFNELIVILIIFAIIDYISGIIVAIKEKTFNSSQGFWGAVKKAMYFVIVLVGYLTDYVLTFTGQSFNTQFTTMGGIGIVITLYLLGTEGLSIIQNMEKMGIMIPFLKKIFTQIKDKNSDGKDDDSK